MIGSENVLELQLEAIQSEFAHFADACSIPQFRTMAQFAEEEIMCPPGGPRAGQPFDPETQPFSKLWFDLVDAEEHCRFVVVAPTQNGKTFMCFAIPALYYLFERGENVGCGIPQLEMAWDKWERDLLPLIKASRYADQIPETGKGSRGGQFSSITFKNGATLKFVSAKGDDAKRSGITFRILVITEIDKFDRPAESSREEDPITQMLARLDAFETLNTIVFMECTASIEKGRIWVEYQASSCGRIVLQCPYCCEWSTPEREHLIGWKTAADELEAREKAHFACPACGCDWTENDRHEANHNAKLLHKGQTIDSDGVITGAMPRTLTAGFRWNAANSLLRSAADCGGREYNAMHKVADENDSNADTPKSILQFMWAKPSASEVSDLMPLNLTALLDRTNGYARGEVPSDCDQITVGLDLGAWWCYWTAIAWGSRARGYIIDHGRIAVPQTTLGLEVALMEAMREFRSICEKGWCKATGEQIIPDENLIDSGWKTTIAYQFIQETGLPFRVCKGLPVGGQEVAYHRPKSTGAIVQYIGEGWHLADLPDDRIRLLEIDANYAKSTLHGRLNCDVNAAGAITMFAFDRKDQPAVEERRNLVRQLTAEKGVEEFEPGRGTITKWFKIRRDNHWLDSTALALMGGSIDGVNAIEAADNEPLPVVPINSTQELVEIIREVVATHKDRLEESSTRVVVLPHDPEASVAGFVRGSAPSSSGSWSGWIRKRGS